MSAIRGKVFSAEEVGFFEGPEKLLEVWYNLDKSDLQSVPPGLRRIKRQDWEKLLEVVKCQILSSCSNESIDAYLLSESSLLVSSNRIILKTCGSTSLLLSIQPLMALVKTYFPNAQIQNLFYSHRSFQEPHLQPLPHTDFKLEVAFLNKMFKGANTARFGVDDDKCEEEFPRYCIPEQLPVQILHTLSRVNDTEGNMVKYLYAYERVKMPTNDQTVEVLMTDLDPEVMSLYCTCAYDSCDELMKDTGLSKLLVDAVVDAKIFHPCGFSLNAVSGDVYYTIHVTPQVGCSWVSFETNAELDAALSLIEGVLTIFSPGKAAISIMANKIRKGIPGNFSQLKGNFKCYSSETSSVGAYKIYYVELHSNKDKKNIYLK